MTARDENEFLTRTGPGTPMGTLFRRYWIPALAAAELPEADGPPVRVGLLSEQLIAFRDSRGRPGLIDEFCAHRGVSLWFGQNEDSGLRCAYHGWKYDLTGQCVEIPSEPAETGYCKRVKLKAYPCIERGGVIWTYMGPPELQPPAPEFEWTTVPESHAYVSRRLQACNYLQAMEGGIDSVHVSFLHRAELKSDPLHRGSKGAEYTGNGDGRFEVVETAGGMIIGVRRPAEPGQVYWRITQWVLPFFTMIPPYGDNALNGHAWVPVDDETCITWSFTHHPTRPLTAREIETMREGGGIHVKLIPGTLRPVANKDNDYLMDRAAQKSGATASGVRTIAMQDASIQESMGPIQDRTKEHLVSSDNAIIVVRRRLRKLALAAAEGARPDAVDPATHRVRSASLVLAEGVPFHEAAAGALAVQEGVAHASV
ncbi:MAG TPA: Rieske 2Fe-2S domain-containing protein [Stellaceae bacterium]|nr:Rieske 2Fe-2S domain-containing protein [Stellaceae bacterium]